MPKITDPTLRGLPPEHLPDMFSYDAETGFLAWKSVGKGRARPGDEAGCVNPTTSNVVVRVRGMALPAARIIVALIQGTWPMEPVRFRDGDPQNLRWNNLILRSLHGDRKHRNKVAREVRRVNRAAIAGMATDPVFGIGWTEAQIELDTASKNVERLEAKLQTRMSAPDREQVKKDLDKAETSRNAARRSLRLILGAKRRYLRDTYPDSYPDTHLRPSGRPRRTWR